MAEGIDATNAAMMESIAAKVGGAMNGGDPMKAISQVFSELMVDEAAELSDACDLLETGLDVFDPTRYAPNDPRRQAITQMGDTAERGLHVARHSKRTSLLLSERQSAVAAATQIERLAANGAQYLAPAMGWYLMLADVLSAALATATLGPKHDRAKAESKTALDKISAFLPRISPAVAAQGGKPAASVQDMVAMAARVGGRMASNTEGGAAVAVTVSATVQTTTQAPPQDPVQAALDVTPADDEAGGSDEPSGDADEAATVEAVEAAEPAPPAPVAQGGKAPKRNRKAD